jgi:glycosyltransferase involved in cell wall biosynthesis
MRRVPRGGRGGSAQTRMRVCQVVDRLTGGGQERIAAEVARGIAGCVDLSGVLATRAGGDYESTLEDVPVLLFVVRRRLRRDPLAWARVYRWLRLHQFDILHTHSPGSLAAALKLRRLPGLEYDVVAHLQMLPPQGTRFRDFAERWYRSASSEVGAVLVTNDHLRGFLTDACGYPPSRVSVVMNPVDVSRWRPSANRLPRSECRVVMVAQWRAQKDHLTAIRAARLVADRGRAVHWLFVGEEDRELTGRARTVVRELGLGSLVHILGRRSDVPRLLADSDVGVLTTHFEGLPVTVLEYGASGLPSIVTRVEGTEMLIGPAHGVIGVPPRDPVALADAVVQLADDPSSRQRLGDAAQASVRSRAGLSAVASEIVAIYREVLARDS